MEILLVIELGIIIIIAVMASATNSEGAIYATIFLIGCVMATTICLAIEWGKPEAIDVYRGETTLEITYKDSVAIDSVVVFKYK